jgi:hypothetical protein
MNSYKQNSYDINTWGGLGYFNYLNRCTLGSSGGKMAPVGAGWYKDSGLFSMSEGGVQHADTYYMYGGTISKQNTVRHTASGYAWKFSPTALYFNSIVPMMLKVGTRAITGGVTTTFGIWMRRDNTGLSARLVVRGGSIAGVDADVQSALMSEAIDTWGGNGSGAPLTVAVTPTETGVVDVYVECWGGTSYSLYVDDFSVA